MAIHPFELFRFSGFGATASQIYEEKWHTLLMGGSTYFLKKLIPKLITIKNPQTTSSKK